MRGRRGGVQRSICGPRVLFVERVSHVRLWGSVRSLLLAVVENKAGAAAHFKAGFGFHPMLCATEDGEPLSIMLRRGNAAANNIADHIDVLDAAVAQLPEAVAAGHCASGGAPAPRQVQLRVDAAGCSVHIGGLPAAQHRVLHDGQTTRSPQP